jgi:hypothetical protein
VAGVLGRPEKDTPRRNPRGVRADAKTFPPYGLAVTDRSELQVVGVVDRVVASTLAGRARLTPRSHESIKRIQGVDSFPGTGAGSRIRQRVRQRTEKPESAQPTSVICPDGPQS